MVRVGYAQGLRFETQKVFLFQKVLFWLPPESPAKMVLGMNIFTSFFVLLLLLSKNVPSATNRIPLIGLLYCINMVMIAISTVCCTVVVHIFFRGNGKVPFLIRKVFLNGLAKLFCMVPPQTLPQLQQSERQKQAALSEKLQKNTVVVLESNQQKPPPATQNFMDYLKRKPSSPFQTVLNIQPMSPNTNDEFKGLAKSCDHLLNCSLNRKSDSAANEQHAMSLSLNPDQRTVVNELNLNFNLIENDVKEIRDYLRHTRKKLETTDAKNKQTNEWKQVALVLDRTLFCIYLVCIVASLLLMFSRF
jgi:hypothetical protein